MRSEFKGHRLDSKYEFERINPNAYIKAPVTDDLLHELYTDDVLVHTFDGTVSTIEHVGNNETYLLKTTTADDNQHVVRNFADLQRKNRKNQFFCVTNPELGKKIASTYFKLQDKLLDHDIDIDVLDKDLQKEIMRIIVTGVSWGADYRNIGKKIIQSVRQKKK